MNTNPQMATVLTQLASMLSAQPGATPALGQVPGATEAENAEFAKKIAEKQAARKDTLRKAAKKMAKSMYEALEALPPALVVREIKAVGDTMRWNHFRTRDHIDYLEREMHKLIELGVDPNGIDHADDLVEDTGSTTVDRSIQQYASHRRALELDEAVLEWSELRLLAADIALGWANTDYENAYGPPRSGIPVSIDTDISDLAFSVFKSKDAAMRERKRLETQQTVPAANRALRATSVSSSVTDFLAR